MKYLITENRVNETIKKYIMTMYPIVYDVKFNFVKKVLGSSEGMPVVEETLIVVIFNDSNNDLNTDLLYSTREEIINLVDTTFNLEHRLYGSNWDFKFFKLSVVQLGTLTAGDKGYLK